MKLSPTFTTITPLSKFLALFFFILFNVLGFSFGRYFQRIEQTRQYLRSYKADFIQRNNSPTQSDDMSNWKTYTNEEYRFEVKYPQNVIPDETNHQENPHLRKDLLSLFEFKDTLDNNRIEFAIDISSSTNEDRIHSIREANNFNFVRPNVQEKVVNLNGHSGVRLDFIHELSGSSLHSSYLIIENNHTYTINADTMYFDQILSTFRFLDEGDVQGVRL